MQAPLPVPPKGGAFAAQSLVGREWRSGDHVSSFTKYHQVAFCKAKKRIGDDSARVGHLQTLQSVAIMCLVVDPFVSRRARNMSGTGLQMSACALSSSVQGHRASLDPQPEPQRP